MTTINDSCGSCGGDINPSDTYVWHYPDEDCRALHDPIPDTGMELVDNSLPRVDMANDEEMERHNKCDDCCPVIGCETCGPCELHETGEE